MKSIAQLEEEYRKAIDLSEKHKKKAADIRKQIEFQQGKLITQKITAMNMNGAEYDKFIKLLASGKRTVLQAADQALFEREKGGMKTNEKEAT